MPVKVDVAPNIDELLFLMANDNDPFNRWQAGQSMAMNSLMALIDGSKPAQDIMDGRYAAAIGKSLNDANIDAALKALILPLPSLAEIAIHIGHNVDHTKIHKARETLSQHISATLETDLLALYNQLNQDKSFEPDAKGAGIRALRMASLQALAKLNMSQYADLAVQHYNNANNMVDMMGSLNIINNLEGFDSAEFIQDFYDKFADNHIVINKWFGLQAMSNQANALEMVVKLTQHDKFSFKTPNNVYALIGGFANGNPLRFHAADGSGYNYLADVIIKLDGINSQVAARMLTPLKSWKSLEPNRQAYAKVALEKIVDVNNLSKDLYEIVTKSLSF